MHTDRETERFYKDFGRILNALEVGIEEREREVWTKLSWL